MKYLITIEGEFYKIAKGEKEKVNILKKYAEELKTRKCNKKQVNKWLKEMIFKNFSLTLNSIYPDIVLPIDKEFFENKNDFTIDN